jgi:hypothetical protein
MYVLYILFLGLIEKEKRKIKKEKVKGVGKCRECRQKANFSVDRK